MNRKYEYTQWTDSYAPIKILKNSRFFKSANHSHWMDHTEILRVNGQRIYIANPYMITPEDLNDFNILRELGWHVAYNKDSAYHSLAQEIIIEKMNYTDIDVLVELTLDNIEKCRKRRKELNVAINAANKQDDMAQSLAFQDEYYRVDEALARNIEKLKLLGAK